MLLGFLLMPLRAYVAVWIEDLDFLIYVLKRAGRGINGSA